MMMMVVVMVVVRRRRRRRRRRTTTTTMMMMMMTEGTFVGLFSFAGRHMNYRLLTTSVHIQRDAFTHEQTSHMPHEVKIS